MAQYYRYAQSSHEYSFRTVVQNVSGQAPWGRVSAGRKSFLITERVLCGGRTSSHTLLSFMCSGVLNGKAIVRFKRNLKVTKRKMLLSFAVYSLSYDSKAQKMNFYEIDLKTNNSNWKLLCVPYSTDTPYKLVIEEILREGTVDSGCALQLGVFLGEIYMMIHCSIT